PDHFAAHAHLHFPEFADDLGAVLARARAAGVRRMITIGTDVPNSRAAVALAAREPDVWAAVGIHPHEASLADEAQLVEIERLAAAPPVVAIGETGLDFFRNLSPHAAQARALPEVAALVPADRAVVETDCPYLPPRPHRGERNEPAYLPITAARVAELRGEPLAGLAARMSENARRLFGL